MPLDLCRISRFPKELGKSITIEFHGKEMFISKPICRISYRFFRTIRLPKKIVHLELKIVI